MKKLVKFEINSPYWCPFREEKLYETDDCPPKQEWVPSCPFSKKQCKSDHEFPDNCIWETVE